jgi:HemY protein
MIRLILILLLLAAGLVVGPQLAGNKGYVLIAFDDYTIEMSVTSAIFLGALLFIALIAALWFTRKIWNITKGSRFWWRDRNQKKAQVNTQNGLVALMRGDYQNAERLMMKGAKNSQTPMLNYLAAAEAAQEQGDSHKRDRYLQRASSDAGETDSAVLLTQARLQLKDQQFGAALDTINKLSSGEQEQNNVRQMRHIIYHEQGQWLALIELLPTLLKQRLISEQQFERQQLEAYRGHFKQLATEGGSEAIADYWNHMPRKVKKHSCIVVAISRALMSAGDQQGAYQILGDVIRKSTDDALFDALGDLRLEDSYALSQQLEKLRRSLGDHPPLLNALAEIYVVEKEFEKAKPLLEASVAKQPKAESLALLAQVCEAQNEPQKALDYYREALGPYYLSANHS